MRGKRKKKKIYRLDESGKVAYGTYCSAQIVRVLSYKCNSVGSKYWK